MDVVTEDLLSEAEADPVMTEDLLSVAVEEPRRSMVDMDERRVELVERCRAEETMEEDEDLCTEELEADWPVVEEVTAAEVEVAKRLEE